MNFGIAEERDKRSILVTFVLFVIRYRHFDLFVALHIATVHKISCASAQCSHFLSIVLEIEFYSYINTSGILPIEDLAEKGT